MDEEYFERVYPIRIREQIEREVELCGLPMNAHELSERLHLLQDVEVLITGWGAPVLDETLLEAAPKLKAVLYGAGSIKHIVTDAFWNRDVLITSAYAANAIPVAEFTLSQILFSLKSGWHLVRSIQAEGDYPRDVQQQLTASPGTYRSTVGLVSLGLIGRHVCRLLRNFDIEVIAYDPYVTEHAAADLQVKLCTLEELFAKADVISVHAPLLPETRGMITGAHLAMMKPRASFINTARGSLVREEEMIEVLRLRPDLQAVLDVTVEEPPTPGSPLYTLPNVTLTPHIAGALAGHESSRMGEYVLEELLRYAGGLPPQYGITREQAKYMA